LKPKMGRLHSRTRYFPVYGLFVSCGGRTIVQSRPLSLKTRAIADASVTTVGKNSRPIRYVGGTILLKRKATDSTTARRTPTRGMARVKATANR
jgi:hypothetical protein